MAPMIIVSGTIRIAESDLERARPIATKMAADSLAEDGCNAYGFWADLGEPGLFRIFEEWESQEAMDAHSASPHFLQFMTDMGTLQITGMDISRYDVSAKGPLFG